MNWVFLEVRQGFGTSVAASCLESRSRESLGHQFVGAFLGSVIAAALSALGLNGALNPKP